ncbi:MAG: Flp pilus assembly complex ATPase component TadA [Chloroflexi bacterium]|nr:Flp pilus assembly complex ATPase component TadA [Chloroflexota bacterium]MBU1750279.1 Flp pilus assembly complex ATPase component TadA [Chloroflexota bacterium]MBU1877618.1 Flp pilus assembly complex ATPase component TadA [Chloroflexota bacterium]
MGRPVTPGTSGQPLTLDQLIEPVQAELHRRGVPIPRWGAPEGERQAFIAAIIRALAELNLVADPDQRRSIGQELADWMLGLGVLQRLVDQPGVEDIFVSNGHVSIVRHGRVEDLGPLAADAYFQRLAERVADLTHQVLSAANPFVLVALPGGHRFTAVVPPVSQNGTAISIRVFPRTPLTLADVVPDPDARAYLAELAGTLRTSLLVSGAPGAGKTTLLGALTDSLPDWAQVRLVEKFAELRYRCALPPFHLLTREDQAEGAVTMGELVDVVTTRTRPHLVIVGEIVADEAAHFLHAANLGVRAWGTIHGNSAYDALLRLEDLALGAGTLPLAAVQVRIARNIGAVAHLGLDHGGRRFVAEIAAVQGLEQGRYILEPVYQQEAAS